MSIRAERAGGSVFPSMLNFIQCISGSSSKSLLYTSSIKTVSLHFPKSPSYFMLERTVAVTTDILHDECSLEAHAPCTGKLVKMLRDRLILRQWHGITTEYSGHGSTRKFTKALRAGSPQPGSSLPSAREAAASLAS